MIHTSVSLLERLRAKPDEAAWQRLDDIYRPLIRRWLQRDPTLRDEAEDLVQDVLTVLVRELPHFQRERPGSFRCWLRTITWNRLQAFRQSRQHRPQLLANNSDGSILSQLEDPHSALSRQWDEEHDRHVVRRLMELIEPQFESVTLQAFRRVVFDGAPAAHVATELNISVNAVLLAKSRVLKRLRQEGEGLVAAERGDTHARHSDHTSEPGPAGGIQPGSARHYPEPGERRTAICQARTR